MLENSSKCCHTLRLPIVLKPERNTVHKYFRTVFVGGHILLIREMCVRSGVESAGELPFAVERYCMPCSNL